MRYLSVLCFLPLLFSACTSETRVTDLTVEYLTNPLGMDVTQPRLSWQIEGKDRGMEQTAYEIKVWKDTPDALKDAYVWQTGKVSSAQSLYITYRGEPLKSSSYYYWQVRVWDNGGNVSPWSETAFWQMGLTEPEDWKGKWIGLDVDYKEPADDHRRLSGRMVRREFEIDKTVKRATVFLSGLGFSELYLNGGKVGDRIMDPTHTNYDRRVLYVAYDVTDRLQQGKNAVGVMLGNGRFFAPRVRIPAPTPSFGYPKLLMQMEIIYSDGSKELVMSDDQWKITDMGPIRANNEFDGEEYDARMEQPGWDKPGFDDLAWQPVQPVEAPKGKLSAQMQEPMRVVEKLQPISVQKIDQGKYKVDFGQNLYGMCKIKVKGPEGTQIVIRTTFDLDSEGNIDMANNRSALSTDMYTLKGVGVEEWAPRFRGQGMRYAEISGWPGEMTKNDVEMLVVHSDLRKVGSFECSDTLVNKIYANLVRTVRMQERGVPMDPDRDERQAWLSVSEMTSETEGYIYDVAAFYDNFLAETRADQREDGCIADAGSYWAWSYTGDPCWPSVITTNPWSNYYMYGDRQSIAVNYPTMKKWVEYLETLADKDYIYRKGVYSDWVDAYTMDTYTPPFGATPKELLSTAYFYYNLKVVERTALFLNKPEEAVRFGEKAAKVKEAFNNTFFNPETGEYKGNTQAGYALAFEFGLVPDQYRQLVADRFVKNVMEEHAGHLTVGCPGTKWLMQSLTNIGRTDVAYTILTQTTRPSWGYMVQTGGTSVWERWDCNTQEPGMNGQSQTILVGYLGAWMYRTLAGIAYDIENPGFKHIIMKPEPVSGLTRVNASFESMYGTIVSNWRTENDRFDWKVTVPPNSTATLYVPTGNASSVKESGQDASAAKNVKFVRFDDGKAVFEIGSGSYEFTADASI